MPITGLGHVGLFCNDLPRMRDFYARTLGLTISDEDLDRGICFLSAAPEAEHHELALVQARDPAQKTHQIQVKEIRLRPKTGEHDIEFKMKQARTFLEHKDKVKLNVMFRGRENAHHERGREILQQVITALEDISKIEKTIGMEGGRSMTAVLSPKG